MDDKGKLIPFRDIYQPLKKDSPRLFDTLERIHTGMTLLSDQLKQTNLDMDSISSDIDNIILGGGQTPWKSDIDGDNHTLYDVQKIGIGLNSPAYSMDAIGDVNITGVYRINGVPLTTGGVPAGSSGQVQWNDAGAFGASANLFWDKTNSRLGIGTVSPAAQLHVKEAPNQNIVIGQNGGLNSISALNDSAANTHLQYVASVHIFTGGKMGLGGTTAPITQLANTGSNISDPGGYGVGANAIGWLHNGVNYVICGENTSTSGSAHGLLIKTASISATSRAMTIMAGGSERLIVNGAGNVGIGLSPSYKLDVSGDCNITGVYRVNGVPISTGGASQTPWLSNIDGAGYALDNTGWIKTAYLKVQADSGYEWYLGSFTSVGPFQLTRRRISDGAWNNAITVLTSGNVGVGGMNPVATFDVSNTDASLNSLPVAGQVKGFVHFSYGNGWGLQFGHLFNGDQWMQCQYAEGSAGTFRLLLNPIGGNIGINTDDPKGTLQLGRWSSTATGAGDLVIAKSAAGPNRAFRLSLDGNYNFELGDYGAAGSAASDPIMVATYGSHRVGFHTNNPGYSVGEAVTIHQTVSGGKAYHLCLWNNSNAANTESTLAFTPNVNVPIGEIGCIHASVGIGALVFRTYVSGMAERMRIHSNNCVGIGTPNPSHPLTVKIPANTSNAYNSQIRLAEQTDNSAYGFHLGYYLEGGAWVGGAQSMVGNVGGPLLLNPNGGNVCVGAHGAPPQGFTIWGRRAGFYANGEPYSLYLAYSGGYNGMWLGALTDSSLVVSDAGGVGKFYVSSVGNITANGWYRSTPGAQTVSSGYLNASNAGHIFINNYSGVPELFGLSNGTDGQIVYLVFYIGLLVKHNYGSYPMHLSSGGDVTVSSGTLLICVYSGALAKWVVVVPQLHT